MSKLTLLAFQCSSSRLCVRNISFDVLKFLRKEYNFRCAQVFHFPCVLLSACAIVFSCCLHIHTQSVVWETSMINRGYLSESTEPGEAGLWRLKTDGVNLQVLWSYPEVLDLSRAYTNNIHAMANTYGIEAACKSIIKV